MSTPYRITLVQLKPDVSAVAPGTDKIDLGVHSIEDICRFAGKLLQVDLSAHPKAEPGIIVHRGERGWRITVHQGRLRMYKSMSLFDDFWTADSARDLAELPPFRETGHSNPTHHSSPATPKSFQTLRAAVEVAGLFVVALVLVAVGLRFGLPQKRLGDVPADVTIVTSADERALIFQTVAGTYATGRTPGHQLITIKPDGQVTKSRIGKDGKTTEPDILEQARAGRRGTVACVVTSSMGVIAGITPPETIQLRNTQYKRIALSTQ